MANRQGGDEPGLVQVQRPNPKKNMVYGPLMPELITTSPYVHSRVKLQNINYYRQPNARVEFIPQIGT